MKLWHERHNSKRAPKVFAFDRDPKRLQTLQSRATNAGCGAPEGQKKKGSKAELVVAECADFLSVDEKAVKYANVRSMLVDPSCSGSGIVGIDRTIDKTRKSDKKEIEKIESKCRHTILTLSVYVFIFSKIFVVFKTPFHM